MNMLEKPASSELYLVRGDSYTLRWVYEVSSTGDEADGVGVDLSGYTVRFTVRDPLTDTPVLEATSDDHITLNFGGDDGVVDLDGPAADTLTVPVTHVGAKKVRVPHRFDWEVTSPAGMVETLWTGDLLCFQDESRSE